MMAALKSKKTLLWPWLGGVAVVVVSGGVIAGVALSGGSTTPERTLRALSGQQLADEKVRAEIRKLENDQQPNADVLPIVGAIVTAGGLLATLLGLLFQRHNEASDRVAELGKARDERLEEIERSQEERFNTLGKLLASDSAGERVSGLVGIGQFTDVSAVYRKRLFVLLGGVLTVDRFATSDRALARAFVALLRRRVDKDGLSTEGLDLQDIELRDVDLRSLALDGVFGDGLKLHGARLHGATLNRARMARADLSGCTGAASLRAVNLTDATLEQAQLRRSSLRNATLKRARLDAAKLDKCDCRGASFEGAAVTSAHFEGANLIGAIFKRADVKEAIFHGATFNDDALRSMLKARNLQRKSFDQRTLADLRRVNAGIDPFEPERSSA